MPRRPMKQSILIIISLIFFQIGYSQKKDTINQFDKNGLKIGCWKLDQVFQGEELSCEGKFIVIPLDKSLDYSKDFDGIVFLHFEKNKYTFEYSGKTDELISVKEGKWISYRKSPEMNNKIAMIEYFDKGHHYKTRTIPAVNSHELFSDYTTVYVLTDSLKRSDTYLEDDSIVFQSYNEKTKYTYYPNNRLNVNKIVLRPNSLYSMPDTVYLKFSARKSVKIDSIYTPNKHLSFYPSNKSYPINFDLAENQFDSIGVIYKPNRNERERKTYMTIHASDCNYKIFFWLNAHDINWRNIRMVDSLTFLKQAKPKIYIQRMGNHTYFKLYKDEYQDNTKNYKPIESGYIHDTGATGPLDISDLKKGEYVLHITSEDVDRKVKILIK